MNRKVAGVKFLASTVFVTALALVSLIAPPAQGKQADPTPTKLLDHLAGRWVMTGRLGAHSVTHDVDVQWVLNREYIRFHEISRPKAIPPYEAIVYITWNAKTNQYSCLWLDSTAAAVNFQPVGYGTPVGNSVPFVITFSPHESIHTTFAYDGNRDRWHLTIDDVTQGKMSRFGDVQLTRRK
ncbi:MAG TPA: hypothetical protein VFO29_12785 [Candidatus Rubrimentiphilum sp.]|nr:hypothetical protein [Candidatus Rubrimentiphilum sp.]